MVNAFANVKIADVLSGKPVGKPKNSHVVRYIPSKPFNAEKMRSQVHGKKSA